MLKLQLPKTVINSYRIAERNGARLEGGGNIGGGSPNEGQNHEATKRTELCKREWTVVMRLHQMLDLHCYVEAKS